jgi:hypothetical protein
MYLNTKHRKQNIYVYPLLYVWIFTKVSIQYNKSVDKSRIKNAGKVLIELLCQFSHEIEYHTVVKKYTVQYFFNWMKHREAFKFSYHSP